MKRFVLNLWERNLDNPLHVGKLEVIEADSLFEICAKFSLLVMQMQRRINNEEISKERLEDDA